MFSVACIVRYKNSKSNIFDAFLSGETKTFFMLGKGEGKVRKTAIGDFFVCVTDIFVEKS